GDATARKAGSAGPPGRGARGGAGRRRPPPPPPRRSTADPKWSSVLPRQRFLGEPRGPAFDRRSERRAARQAPGLGYGLGAQEPVRRFLGHALPQRHGLLYVARLARGVGRPREPVVTPVLLVHLLIPP